MLTPFLEDGAVDFPALGKLTDFYLKAGARGLFANCLSSEMFDLRPSEQLEVISHVVQCAGASVPVVAAAVLEGGTFHEQREVDRIKQIYGLGADSVVLLLNHLIQPEEPEELLEERLLRLLSQTEGVPIGFYECPEPYKRCMSAGLLARLVATGRVRYYKDTSSDLHAVAAKLARITGHFSDRDFGLYEAHMPHALESLKAGAAGLSCIQGNYFPELIVWLCRFYGQPDRQSEVHQVQQFLTQHMRIMHQTYPMSAKYFLRLRGLEIGMYTRRKAPIFGKVEQGAMESLYQEFL